MIKPETLIIKNLFMRDGTAFCDLVLNESAPAINGFVAVRSTKDGRESTNTVYINAAEIQGIEIADEMLPLAYDFIKPRKIQVKD